jgi:hypothetical protein
MHVEMKYAQKFSHKTWGDLGVDVIITLKWIAKRDRERD